MDVLIKNMVLPTEDEQVNITILSDGSVIEHFRTEKGRWTSYRSGGVKAIELPPHGELIERSSVYKVLDDRVALYKEVGDEYNACNMACIEGDIVTIPTVLEASTEANNKTETPRKARICPHYQGVCDLDEDIVCYCSSSYEKCNKYREASNE